jgi:hypothetical protein
MGEVDIRIRATKNIALTYDPSVRGRSNLIEQEQEIIINTYNNNKLVDFCKKPNYTSKYLKIPI